MTLGNMLSSRRTARRGPTFDIALVARLRALFRPLVSWMESKMAKRTSKGKVTMYRSAKTGRAVTKSYAKGHPATTEKETYRRKPKKK